MGSPIHPGLAPALAPEALAAIPAAEAPSVLDGFAPAAPAASAAAADMPSAPANVVEAAPAVRRTGRSWSIQDIRLAWNLAFGGPRASLVETTPSGAEMYSIPAGRRSATVHIDKETLALARGLQKGDSFTVYGSKALEMLQPDGPVARTGVFSPQGDVDLFVRGIDENLFVPMRWSRHVLARYYKNNEGSVSTKSSGFVDRYSLAGLKINFLNLGDGRVAARWDSPGSADRGYRDWTARVIRYSWWRPMSFGNAVQGLLYLVRYPGMSIHSRTERRMRRKLRSYVLDDRGHLDRGDQERVDKLFSRALDSGHLRSVLERFGVPLGPDGKIGWRR